MKSIRPHHILLVLASLSLAAIPLRAQTDILIHTDRPFPESITSTPDGALIIGSVSKSMVFRAAPGAATAEPFIQPHANGLQRVYGVLADPRANTLWVCSTKVGDGNPTALKSFDLKTGATKDSFNFPENDGTCNDIAVRKNGDAYVADTKNGRILRLKRGAPAFETWIKDPLLSAVDGIAFGDNNTLFVNTYTPSTLVRLHILKGGGAGPVEPLKTSVPILHPDGMRHLTKDSFLMVEGPGRLDKVIVHGDIATIQVLKDGFISPTAVDHIGNTGWVIEGKLNMMADPTKDPGPSLIHPVPLGK